MQTPKRGKTMEQVQVTLSYTLGNFGDFRKLLPLRYSYYTGFKTKEFCCQDISKKFTIYNINEQY